MIRPDKQTEVQMKRALALRLARALGTAAGYARAIVAYDTGDLHDSIRVIDPVIRGDRIITGIAAGGVPGERRGTMIDYARTIEETQPFLRPAMDQSGWESELHGP